MNIKKTDEREDDTECDEWFTTTSLIYCLLDFEQLYFHHQVIEKEEKEKIRPPETNVSYPVGYGCFLSLDHASGTVYLLLFATLTHLRASGNCWKRFCSSDDHGAAVALNWRLQMNLLTS